MPTSWMFCARFCAVTTTSSRTSAARPTPDTSNPTPPNAAQSLAIPMAPSVDYCWSRDIGRSHLNHPSLRFILRKGRRAQSVCDSETRASLLAERLTTGTRPSSFTMFRMNHWVNQRMGEHQPMHRSAEAARLLLQVRCKVFDQRLDKPFRERYTLFRVMAPTAELRAASGGAARCRHKMVTAE